MEQEPQEKLLSEVVQEIADKNQETEKTTIGELLSLMEDRAFGLAILIFCLPNAQPIPMIPGMSTIFAVPILFFAAQMLFGMEKIWLPEYISKKEIHGETVRLFSTRAVSKLKKLEAFIKPRMSFLASQHAEKLLSILILFMATIISLPIPFANTLPAISISLIAIGIISRDGYMVIAGMACSAVATLVAGMVILGSLAFITAIFSWLPAWMM